MFVIAIVRFCTEQIVPVKTTGDDISTHIHAVRLLVGFTLSLFFVFFCISEMIVYKYYKLTLWSICSIF